MAGLVFNYFTLRYILLHLKQQKSSSPTCFFYHSYLHDPLPCCALSLMQGPAHILTACCITVPNKWLPADFTCQVYCRFIIFYEAVLHIALSTLLLLNYPQIVASSLQSPSSYLVWLEDCRQGGVAPLVIAVFTLHNLFILHLLLHQHLLHASVVLCAELYGVRGDILTNS
jgi:hypothetical protein